jgi:hypothetical protein
MNTWPFWQLERISYFAKSPLNQIRASEMHVWTLFVADEDVILNKSNPLPETRYHIIWSQQLASFDYMRHASSALTAVAAHLALATIDQSYELESGQCDNEE